MEDKGMAEPLKAGSTAAIILAAGKGSRMGGSMAKQYLPLCGKPLIFYALQAYEESDIDDIVLVVDYGHIDYVRSEVIAKFDFRKIKAVVAGGSQRYESVMEGLKALHGGQTEYVLIHDGARALIPFLLINKIINDVKISKACAAALPSKDTVRLTGSDGCVRSTPPRDQVWLMQTPQAFMYSLIRDAYDGMKEEDWAGITDDCAVLEKKGTHGIHMIRGSERNFKVTTPEDFRLAEAFIQQS